MRILAYAVKTPKGKIYPTWIFDNESEAQDHADKLNESFYPHNYGVEPCEITLLSHVKPETKEEV